MFYTFGELLIMLVIILVAAEIFTNALEHLGQKLNISEGVTGSLFAAIGTALPETLVPILAILGGTSDANVNHEIGVGAILGAPLMLSTLSICLMGCSVIRMRGLNGTIRPEETGLRRDLSIFILSYAFAAVAMFIPHEGHGGVIKAVFSFILVALYLIYVMMTLKASAELVESGHATEASHPMYLCKFKLPENTATIILQLAIGLGLLVGGAKGFIHGVNDASGYLGITPLLLSLMVIPIATELPEKINSILWVRQGKDTLALGNITGAMVFQGTLLPAIGIALTPWQARPEVFLSLSVTMVAAIWLRYIAHKAGGIKIWFLLLNGLLYAAYLYISI